MYLFKKGGVPNTLKIEIWAFYDFKQKENVSHFGCRSHRSVELGNEPNQFCGGKKNSCSAIQPCELHGSDGDLLTTGDNQENSNRLPKGERASSEKGAYLLFTQIIISCHLKDMKTVTKNTMRYSYDVQKHGLETKFETDLNFDIQA